VVHSYNISINSENATRAALDSYVSQYVRTCKGGVMNKLLAAALLSAAITAPALAVEIRTPVARPAFTCAVSSLSRVVFGAEQAPCCTGLMGCPQLLANTGFAKAKPANRT
jgi:hypothetical protein